MILELVLTIFLPITVWLIIVGPIAVFLIRLFTLLIVILFGTFLLVLLSIRFSLASFSIALIFTAFGTLWLIHWLVLVPVNSLLLRGSVSRRIAVWIVCGSGSDIAALLLVFKVLTSLWLMSCLSGRIRATSARLSPSSASHV